MVKEVLSEWENLSNWPLGKMSCLSGKVDRVFPSPHHHVFQGLRKMRLLGKSVTVFFSHSL
jgi:hypothetical protein